MACVVNEHDYDLRANLVLFQILRAIKTHQKRQTTEEVKTLIQLVKKNIRSIYKEKKQGALLAKLPFKKTQLATQ